MLSFCLRVWRLRHSAVPVRRYCIGRKSPEDLDVERRLPHGPWAQLCGLAESFENLRTSDREKTSGLQYGSNTWSTTVSFLIANGEALGPFCQASYRGSNLCPPIGVPCVTGKPRTTFLRMAGRSSSRSAHCRRHHRSLHDLLLRNRLSRQSRHPRRSRLLLGRPVWSWRRPPRHRHADRIR